MIVPETRPEKQTDTRKEKLSERLEIRVHHSVKTRFLNACRKAGDTPSDILRAAMQDYIQTVDKAERLNPIRELSMTFIDNPLKTLGAMGAGVVAVIAFSAAPSAADQAATPLNHPEDVTYPTDLAEQGVTGECWATFTVTADGKPDSVSVQCSHPGFEQSTRDAVNQLIFQPKTVDGVPVAEENVTYPLIFQMDE